MKNKLTKIFLNWSISKKVAIFMIAVVFALVIDVGFDFFVVEYTSSGFGEIIKEISLCYELQDSLEVEKQLFTSFIRNGNNIDELREITQRTDTIVDKLPLELKHMHKDRYARTWNIKNSYPIYVQNRQEVLDNKYATKDFIDKVYNIYEMQDYLIEYSERLMEVTISENNAMIKERSELFKKMPIILGVIIIPLIMMIIYMAIRLQKLIINPINKMADVSKNIAKNNFSDGDILIKNKDELGDLANAFNKMKHATVAYIQSLEEKYELSQLLHQEEMEKVEMEKRLNAARFDLLKSQINPHFLFNTLNTIAASANLEDAKDTEEMIRALGNIFRYNLKTDEVYVSLAREISIVEDYMYIQKMRFGSRIDYEIKSDVDNESVYIPSFSLQPIVENAIIHGISKKEEGGRIIIRIRQRDDVLNIIVADTGVGITRERLSQLREFMHERPTARAGIGFGNIYKRIKSMYKNGDLRIYSREKKMTVLHFLIPQKLYQNNKD